MKTKSDNPPGAPDNDLSSLSIAELQNAAGHGASAIKSKLKRAIESGVYSHGDRLLPERELAASFKTARNTIRSALRQLEADGLVERRVGSGTFVNFDSKKTGSPLDINESMSPLQLIEARFAVEPYVTRLAAINATQNDLENMEVLINRLDACGWRIPRASCALCPQSVTVELLSTDQPHKITRPVAGNERRSADTEPDPRLQHPAPKPVRSALPKKRRRCGQMHQRTPRKSQSRPRWC